MPTMFDEREQAFERRFAHEEDVRFHVRARRNRLLAAWACERMRLTGAAAETYIRAIGEAGVVAADEELVARVHADLAAAGVEETLPVLRSQMERFAATARAEQRVGEALDRDR